MRHFIILIIVCCSGIFMGLDSSERTITQEDIMKLHRVNRKVEFYGTEKYSEPNYILNKQQLEKFLKEEGLKLIYKGMKREPKDILKTKIKITSSGYLKDKKRYSPKYAHDNKLKTAWVEGKRGDGFKEWINFRYKFKIDPKGEYNTSSADIGFQYIIINPGYAASDKLFKENNRVRTLVVVGTSRKERYLKHMTKREVALRGIDKKYIVKKSIVMDKLRLKDVNKYQVFRFTSIFMLGNDLEYRFYIESVYKGSKYNDTCISEIMFGMLE